MRPWVVYIDSSVLHEYTLYLLIMCFSKKRTLDDPINIRMILTDFNTKSFLLKKTKQGF
jgi:hypothetical protein